MKTKIMGLNSFIGSNSRPSQADAGAQSVLSTFLFKTLNHKQITIWCDGETRRGNLYLKDILFEISKVKKSLLGSQLIRYKMEWPSFLNIGH